MLRLFWIHSPEKRLRTVEGPVGALERQTFHELWILSYGFSLKSVRVSLFVCLRLSVFFFPLCDINPLYLLLWKWASIFFRKRNTLICILLLLSFRKTYLNKTASLLIYIWKSCVHQSGYVIIHAYNSRKCYIDFIHDVCFIYTFF